MEADWINSHTVAHLKNVRDVLKSKGWSQWHIRDPITGAVCLEGAVCSPWLHDEEVYPWAGAPNQVKSLSAIRAVLCAAIDVAGMTHDSWNDMPGRTVEEVYAVIDKAISSIESGTFDCATVDVLVGEAYENHKRLHKAARAKVSEARRRLGVKAP